MKFYPTQLYPKKKLFPETFLNLPRQVEKFMYLNRNGTFPEHQMSGISGTTVRRVTANESEKDVST